MVLPSRRLPTSAPRHAFRRCVRRRRTIFGLETLEPRRLLAIDIVINAGSGLAANPLALAAFDRAAAAWEARIDDPITVTIDADLADLGDPTLIGQAETVLLAGGYDVIRDQLVADSADENDESVVAALPTAAQASFLMPGGFKLDGRLVGAKAALKAAGFTGLDEQFGTGDAIITFNSQFAFDFDNNNGVEPGQMDFETVAAHEIGHALGFVSEVDTIDLVSGLGGPRPRISPSVLDLFRFEDNTLNDPANLGEFNAFPRSLVPGVEAVTDQIQAKPGVADENDMSTGYFTGDGRQASHWKDGELSGHVIGAMDPTLTFGQVIPIGEADLRALDLIGYDIAFDADPNSPPVALDDSAKIGKKNGVATGNVLDNDFDPEGESMEAQLVAAPSAGTVVLSADGSFTYTPGASFSGTDTFSYVAVQQDGLESNIATVTVSSGAGGGPGGSGGGGRGSARSASVTTAGFDAGGLASAQTSIAVYTPHSRLQRDMQAAVDSADASDAGAASFNRGYLGLALPPGSWLLGDGNLDSTVRPPVETAVSVEAADFCLADYGFTSDLPSAGLANSSPDRQDDLSRLLSAQNNHAVDAALAVWDADQTPGDSFTDGLDDRLMS